MKELGDKPSHSANNTGIPEGNRCRNSRCSRPFGWRLAFPFRFEPSTVPDNANVETNAHLFLSGCIASGSFYGFNQCRQLGLLCD